MATFSNKAFSTNAFSTNAFDFGLLEIFVQLQGNAWVPSQRPKKEEIKRKQLIKPNERYDQLSLARLDDEEILLLVSAAVARSMNER